MILRAIFFSCVLLAQSLAADDGKTGLEALLHDFMAGASVSDAAIHDRFWAEELVYTSSSGTRFGKAEIMEGLAESNPDEAPMVTYRAEDLDIRLYGETAVVAFKLVGEGPETTTEYFNTGTFRQIAGEWKAVAWQATRIGESPAAQD